MVDSLDYKLCIKNIHFLYDLTNFVKILEENPLQHTLFCSGGSILVHTAILNYYAPYFIVDVSSKEDPNNNCFCNFNMQYLDGIQFSELKTIVSLLYEGSVTVTRRQIEPLSRIIKLSLQGRNLNSSFSSSSSSGQVTVDRLESPFKICDLEFNSTLLNQREAQSSNDIRYGKWYLLHFKLFVYQVKKIKYLNPVQLAKNVFFSIILLTFIIILTKWQKKKTNVYTFLKLKIF